MRLWQFSTVGGVGLTMKISASSCGSAVVGCLQPGPTPSQSQSMFPFRHCLQGTDCALCGKPQVACIARLVIAGMLKSGVAASITFVWGVCHDKRRQLWMRTGRTPSNKENSDPSNYLLKGRPKHMSTMLTIACRVSFSHEERAMHQKKPVRRHWSHR